MADWSHEPLGSLVSFQKGRKVQVVDTPRDGFIPYLGASAISGKIEEYGCASSGVLCSPDSVLMLWDGERSGLVGKARIGVISSTMSRLNANEKIDGTFLYYFLNDKFDWIQSRRTGTGVPHVPKDLSKILIVSYPNNKVEQKKIAHILTTVDNLIEKTQALIDKYTAVKQGMMHDLFTRGIDLATGQLRPRYEEAPHLYKETELGWVPKEWGVCLLDKLAERGSGHTPSKSHPEYWNGGIKWVSLADSSKLDNLYIYDTDKNISELGIQNSSAVKHPAGTVILSRDAGIGKSAILSEEMAVSQHFMAWRCGNMMDSYFLYFWLQYKKPMFEAIAMGSTIATIGLGFFKKLQIATSIDINEQAEIGKKLLQVHQFISTSGELLEQYQQIKKGLMQDLLTGRVRVSA